MIKCAIKGWREQWADKTPCWECQTNKILSISWSPFITRPVHSVICGRGLNSWISTRLGLLIQLFALIIWLAIAQWAWIKTFLWIYIFGILVIRCFGPSVFCFRCFGFRCVGIRCFGLSVFWPVFVPQDWWNWQIKWMKSVSMGSYQYKNKVNGEGFFFAYLWVILLYFNLESRLIPAVLELGQVRLFWKSIRSRIWQLSHRCQTWAYFPCSLALR